MSPLVDLTETEAEHLEARREMRALADVERAANRKSLNREARFRARLRDGDQCRVCGGSVDFDAVRGRRGQFLVRGGVYVVCVKHGQKYQAQKVEDLDAQVPDLRPAPAKPFYRPTTVKWLREEAAVNSVAGVADEFDNGGNVERFGMRRGVRNVCAVGEDHQLVIAKKVRGVLGADLPVRFWGYYNGLRFTSFLVRQGHRLRSVVEARLDRALKQSSSMQVADGNDAARVGQHDLGGHDGNSSARASESTERGGA